MFLFSNIHIYFEETFNYLYFFLIINKIIFMIKVVIFLKVNIDIRSKKALILKEIIGFYK